MEVGTWMFIETLFTGIFQILGWIFFLILGIFALMVLYHKAQIKFADIFGKTYEHSNNKVIKAYILKLEDIDELDHIKTNAKNAYAKILASERLNYLKQINGFFLIFCEI